MSQSGSLSSPYNTTNQPWHYESDMNEEDDVNESLARLEKKHLDQQQQHLNRLRLLKERENGLASDQAHYRRSRTISRTEDSNYTRATSSSRSRAAATAAEKAGSISTNRKRVSSRDTRYSSTANQRSDYDTGSENGEPRSPTQSKYTTIKHRRPSAAAQITEIDKDLLLRSSSLQTRRVSDAQLVRVFSYVALGGDYVLTFFYSRPLQECIIVKRLRDYSTNESLGSLSPFSIPALLSMRFQRIENSRRCLLQIPTSPIETDCQCCLMKRILMPVQSISCRGKVA